MNNVRKVDTILLPEEYCSILKRFGNVYVYGEDWESFDFRSATQHHLKAKKPFKISDAHMLRFISGQVGFKTSYSADYCHHSVLKRGKRWADFRPAPLPMESTVTDAKKRDVLSLLAEIGASDEVPAFYDSALSVVNEAGAASSDDEQPEQG